MLQYSAGADSGQASLKVEYVGDEQALTNAAAKDIFDVESRWLELRTDQEISTPTAIHASVSHGVVLYRAVCGACFDVVGNLSSQDFFDSWYAHVRSVRMCSVLADKKKTATLTFLPLSSFLSFFFFESTVWNS